MGCRRRCRRLSCLGKVMQRAKDWGGPSLSCLWALNLAQPPLSLHFPACCVLGQQKGLQETLSLPDHTALPPAPQGARLPSRACGFAAPFSLQAGAVIVCDAQEGNRSGRGGLLVGMRAALALQLGSPSGASIGSGAGALVCEATMLSAAGCPHQCSFCSKALVPCLPLGGKPKT